MKYSPFRTNAALAATCLILAFVFGQFSDSGALNLQAQGPSEGLSTKLLARHQRERQAFQFGLIGDTQYNAEQEAKFHNLKGAMNRERLSFVVHDGDIRAELPLALTNCSPIVSRHTMLRGIHSMAGGARERCEACEAVGLKLSARSIVAAVGLVEKPLD